MLGRINDENIGVGAFLLQNHDDGWDTGAKENICREADNRINVVLFNEITTNVLSSRYRRTDITGCKKRDGYTFDKKRRCLVLAATRRQSFAGGYLNANKQIERGTAANIQK